MSRVMRKFIFEVVNIETIQEKYLEDFPGYLNFNGNSADFILHVTKDDNPDFLPDQDISDKDFSFSLSFNLNKENKFEVSVVDPEDLTQLSKTFTNFVNFVNTGNNKFKYYSIKNQLKANISNIIKELAKSL